jgi:hypothetical protein
LSASAFVIFAFGRNNVFPAIKSFSLAASMYLHPQSPITSENIPLQSSITGFHDTPIITFIISFRVIEASSRYLEGEKLCELITFFAAKYSAAKRSSSTVFCHIGTHATLYQSSLQQTEIFVFIQLTLFFTLLY